MELIKIVRKGAALYSIVDKTNDLINHYTDLDNVYRTMEYNVELLETTFTWVFEKNVNTEDMQRLITALEIEFAECQIINQIISKY